MAEEFDCIVIGGGPAGSTAAALIAEAGPKTLLLEREQHPRFHIGESLMPETYWTLKRLGVLDKMKGSEHPQKYSVQFVNHQGKESAPFYFRDEHDHESSVTWQVVRGDFDKMLFDNAAEKGAVCREQTRVLDLLRDGDRVVGVKARSDGEEPCDLRAKVVVDASGQSSLIANQFKLREPNDQLRKASIWSYFRGAHRDSGVDEGATVILSSEDKQAWFWYIPLADDLVSVGVVADVDYLLRKGISPEDRFADELRRCSAVARRIDGATRADEFRVTRDFSYVTKRPAGDGWVLIGDAGGCLDPIYSSGVCLALQSGEMAAEAIVEGG
ncbi:MAG: tryptophan 7-halogenase, partial [Planctomycetales bacterium]